MGFSAPKSSGPGRRREEKPVTMRSGSLKVVFLIGVLVAVGTAEVSATNWTGGIGQAE